MHKEKIKYYDPVKKQMVEIEVKTFDTVVHLTKGLKHIMRDIDRLIDEEERNNQREINKGG